MYGILSFGVKIPETFYLCRTKGHVAATEIGLELSKLQTVINDPTVSTAVKEGAEEKVKKLKKLLIDHLPPNPPAGGSEQAEPEKKATASQEETLQDLAAAVTGG